MYLVIYTYTAIHKYKSCMTFARLDCHLPMETFDGWSFSLLRP